MNSWLNSVGPTHLCCEGLRDCRGRLVPAANAGAGCDGVVKGFSPPAIQAGLPSLPGEVSRGSQTARAGDVTSAAALPLLISCRAAGVLGCSSWSHGSDHANGLACTGLDTDLPRQATLLTASAPEAWAASAAIAVHRSTLAEVSSPTRSSCIRTPRASAAQPSSVSSISSGAPSAAEAASSGPLLTGHLDYSVKVVGRVNTRSRFCPQGNAMQCRVLTDPSNSFTSTGGALLRQNWPPFVGK